MRQMLRYLCLGLAAMTLSLAVVGCDSTPLKPERITANDVRNDLNPEYFTTIRSWEQRQNYDAIVRNLNGRQMVDDWYNFWLANPSRLTAYPPLY